MKKNRYLIPIFILILGMAIFMEKMAVRSTNKKSSSEQTEVEKVDPTKTDFVGEPIEQKTKEIQVQAASASPAQTIKVQEFGKCASFLKINSQGDSASQALEQIKSHYDLVKDVVDMTEYQLRTRSNEELVVQHIPGEEIKNQVRIFKTADDGFPDRVKKFPNSNGSEKQKLMGALTLGERTKKIEKYKVVNSDRSVLAYEKSEGVVTRVDFTNGKNKLICEDQRCQCHEF
ncbi:MAG: hypothetical protein H7256_02540 [Bdellovibrio sp.]|nr:hypothetical protein [Bdellovibrio sp.]